MGVTWQEFWGMNPHIIKCIAKGYDKKIRQEDFLQHMWWGDYGTSAVYVAVDRAIWGRKAKSKYIEKPALFKEEVAENGYKESQEEVAVFEMKQRIEALRQQGLPESPE